MGTFRLNENPSESSGVKEVKQPEVLELNKTVLPDTTEESKSGVKEIILKGPLGHAYTEALKLLLNKTTNKSGDIRQENMQEALISQVILEEEEPTESIPENSKGFVYVYDGKKMGTGELSNMFEDLSGAKEAHPEAGYVSGTIENAEALLKDPAKARNLETMMLSLESVGIPLHYTRKACLDGIVKFINKG